MASAEPGARVIVRCGVEPPRWRCGELLIRRYRAADHDAVIRLHREALAQVGLRPGDGVYYDDDLDRITEVYLRGRGDFLVGHLVATAEPSGVAGVVGARGAAGVRGTAGARGTGGTWSTGGALDAARETGHSAAAGFPAGPVRLVAMGALRPLAGRHGSLIGEMVRLRVCPRVQRHGYGTAMVLALEERARELGYRVLCGDTTERQQPALALYRTLGWHVTGRRPIGRLVNVYIEKAVT